MTVAVLYKLLAILPIIAMGWVVGRLRWLGDAQADPAWQRGVRARRGLPVAAGLFGDMGLGST